MTRVLGQRRGGGTAGTIPTQPFSATCPMSHSYLLEKEQRVVGAPEPRGTIRKDAGHGTRDSSAQQLIQFLLDQSAQSLACCLHPHAFEVELGCWGY